jgi:hypothetical protein
VLRTTVIAGLVLISVVCIPAWAHPKPGAHADVRFTIDSKGVRGEFLMNLSFVDGLIQVRRQARDDVQPDEEGDLRAALLEYFGGPASGGSPRSLDRPNAIVIDGQPSVATEQTFRIVRPEPETRPGFVQNPLMLIPQVHMVLVYPSAARPRKVSISWGSFPRDFLDPREQIPPPVEIEAVLLAEGEIRLVKFTKSEPEIVWHTSGAPMRSRMAAVPTTPVAQTTIPIVSIALPLAWLCWPMLRLPGSRRGWALGLLPVLVGSAAAWNHARVPVPSMPREGPPEMSDPESSEVFTLLHANIYRAFDYSDEGEIYDALATSVDGPLLDSMYTQVYRSLIMQEEGGALSRVQAVRHLAREVRRPNPRARDGACVIDARWQVDGMVYHWGHSHTRRSEFRAEYTIARRGDGWRIVACKPMEQFRVPMEGEVLPAEPTIAPKEVPWRPDR